MSNLQFTKLAQNYIDKNKLTINSEKDEINIANAIIGEKVNGLVAKCIIYEYPDIILNPIFKKNNIKYEDLTYNSDKYKIIMDLIKIPFQTFIEYIIKSHKVINSFNLCYLSAERNINLSSDILINWFNTSLLDEIETTLECFSDIIYYISSNLKDPERLINYLEAPLRKVHERVTKNPYDIFSYKLNNLVTELNKIKNIRHIELELNKIKEKLDKNNLIAIKPYYLTDDCIRYYGTMKCSIISLKDKSPYKIYFIPIDAFVINKNGDEIFICKINEETLKDLQKDCTQKDFICFDNKNNINGYIWRNNYTFTLLKKIYQNGSLDKNQEK